MKKHIFSLLLIVLSFALNAQNDRLGANLFGIIVTPVSGDTFQVEGNYNDPSGVTDGNDLAIGDVLWTVGANSGDTCRVMSITDIVTAFAGYVVFEVDANGQGAPSTQNSKLMRLTPDNNLAYVPQQGNEGLIECISQYFAFQLDAGTGAPSGALLAANNLSDLANATTARTNLGADVAANVNIVDAGGYYVATEVEAALQEGAVERSVLDGLIGDLVTLSGVPVTSTDLGTFTGTIIPPNQTNKAAFQALENKAQSLTDSKLDSLTFSPATDTTYTVVRQYAAGVVAQLDTIYFPAGGGGGGISGLTTNFFPVATSSTTIGNGPISYTSGTSTINYPSTAQNWNFDNIWKWENLRLNPRFNYTSVSSAGTWSLARNGTNHVTYKPTDAQFKIESGAKLAIGVYDITASSATTTYQTTSPSIGVELLFKDFSGGTDIDYSPVDKDWIFSSSMKLGLGGIDPSYLLDLGGTSAAMRLTPHDNALTGTEGLFFAHNASNQFKGHDGTSLYRFAKYSDVAATDGQIAVYNSASDRWVPSNVSTLLNTQTNYQIDVSETEAGTNFRTVYGGDSEAAIGITQDGSDAAIVQLSVYNSSTNLKSLLTLSEGEASLEGAVARVKGTDVVVNSNLSDITMIALGAALKQTGFVIDDTSAIRVIATTAPNFAGIQYSSSAVRAKLTDLSLTDKGYVDSLFAQGFQGSVVLPDSLVSILTSDGAGIEFFSDRVNLVGTEVTVNDQVIPMQDTLVVPLYAQPHGEAAATGNDYRGWRVPPDLDGARLIGVHYSFDTPGSDTAIIQIGNGTVNVFGGTIPATGFVNVTASRVLVANEKWTPSIGTLNGTGHEGLMLNLIIERNR